ncbi:hypothetical protein B0H14DRAFT_310762 [Mycena olivaceomarginata]|nr:hypothetical protein B0H14DRAFT_310762 [Mycena olivaceomarginata]
MRAAEHRYADMAKVMSGIKCEDYFDPAVYGHYSSPKPGGKGYTGQSCDPERRDGEHVKSKGNSLRQAEEQVAGPFVHWRREIIVGVQQAMFIGGDRKITQVMLLPMEHLLMTGLGTVVSGRGLNKNALDFGTMEAKVSNEMLEIAWNAGHLWRRWRLERHLSARFHTAQDVEFWSQFLPFVGHMITPAYLGEIFYGQARLHTTSKFTPFPREAYGTVLPLSMFPHAERAAQRPFHVSAPAPMTMRTSKRHRGSAPVHVTDPDPSSIRGLTNAASILGGSSTKPIDVKKSRRGKKGVFVDL